MRELAVEWLRENVPFEVVSPGEGDAIAERAASACARPIDTAAWATSGAYSVSIIAVSCDDDDVGNRETCRIDLDAIGRHWDAPLARPLSGRTLRAAVAGLREGLVIGYADGWPHWADDPPLELALAEALPREHQRVLAASVDPWSAAATSLDPFEHCFREHGASEARVEICIDVAPDGSVSNPIVLTPASRPIERMAARAYRSASGERAPTELDRCLLNAATSVRFPCITEPTRVGAFITFRR
ncbi:MAG: hypothetical protein M3Y87_08220 [Myxococcota bacterium]|nr:hypothetical protein [Myxococcota bacterium]